MDDGHARLILGLVGVGFAGSAWLLYRLTSEEEPAGFTVLPTNTRAWMGYCFRTAELALAACLLLGYFGVLNRLVAWAFLVSVAAMLVSSIAFWNQRRDLSEFGVGSLILASMGALLTPAVA